MAFEIQIFEVFTATGGTGTYTVIAGDKWKKLNTIVEQVSLHEAIAAAKKVTQELAA